MTKIENYITGQWITGDGEGQTLYNAVTGQAIVNATTIAIDLAAALDYSP